MQVSHRMLNFATSSEPYKWLERYSRNEIQQTSAADIAGSKLWSLGRRLGRNPSIYSNPDFGTEEEKVCVVRK
jgi:hypothetical protein